MSPLCRFSETFLAGFTDLHTYPYMGKVSSDKSYLALCIFYACRVSVSPYFRIHVPWVT
jgi:hypothetical protein